MAEAQEAASRSAGGVALVTGATGLVGRYLVMHLQQLGTWKVYAVSRKDKLEYEEMPEGLGGRVIPVQVSNLLDPEAVQQALQPLTDVTHIFHCAYLTSGSDQFKDATDNLALMKHVVEAIEAAQAAKGSAHDNAPADPGGSSAAAPAAGGGGGGGPKLQHVYAQAGAKWYGQHLGKYKTPAKESDPRYMTPNFYYDLVDYCQARVQAGAPWTFSSTLPNPVIGYSPASYMNLANAIAGYAALCKELKLPFRFPGPDAAYEALTECCDARLLAEAILFVATHPEAANHIYNVSNGDVFRWSEVWPKIAAHYNLEVAPPQAICLQECMSSPDKTGAWTVLLERHSLANHPAAAAYGKLIPWGFADFCFSKGYDFFQSVTKLRQAGFEGMKLDSGDMWVGWMEELKKLGVFPL